MRAHDDRSSADPDDAAAPAPVRQLRRATVGHKSVLDWLALVLLIAGGLNWGLVGLFGVDAVSGMFGPGSPASRVVFVALGVAALWGFALMRLGPERRG